MSSSTPEKAPIIVDKEIGYSKFTKTKTYTVRVEYEVIAKNKDDADRIIEDNAGIDKVIFEDNYINYESPEDVKTDGYSVDEIEEEHYVTKKIAECIPETYTDDNNKEKEDPESGEWVTNDFEYKKNEDGTDIK